MRREIVGRFVLVIGPWWWRKRLISDELVLGLFRRVFDGCGRVYVSVSTTTTIAQPTKTDLIAAELYGRCVSVGYLCLVILSIDNHDLETDSAVFAGQRALRHPGCRSTEMA